MGKEAIRHLPVGTDKKKKEKLDQGNERFEISGSDIL
jgi:hypothetical protein